MRTILPANSLLTTWSLLHSFEIKQILKRTYLLTMDVTSYLVLNLTQNSRNSNLPNQTEHFILKESYVIEKKLCERNNYVNSHFFDIPLILST